LREVLGAGSMELNNTVPSLLFSSLWGIKRPKLILKMKTSICNWAVEKGINLFMRQKVDFLEVLHEKALI
jgi:hypothetical protein